MVTTELNRHLSLLGGRSLLQTTALSNLSCVITFRHSLIFVKQETTFNTKDNLNLVVLMLDQFQTVVTMRFYGT